MAAFRQLSTHGQTFDPESLYERFLEHCMYALTTTARLLASQAEAIVRTGKTWPQATKRRN